MDATSNSPASSDLAQYGALLRRRWWVVVVCALLGLVAGGGLMLTQPKVYTASTQVLIKDTGFADSTEQGNGNKNKGVNLDTEATLAKSLPVATMAKQSLGGDRSPATMLKHVTADPVPSSTVLMISYSADTPAAAQRGAQAFARAHLEIRNIRAETALRNKINTVRSRIETLQLKQRELTRERAQLPVGDAERQLLQLRRESTRRQIVTLSEKIANLEGEAVDPGAITSDAQRPSSPTSPLPPLYLGSGLMIGLLVGVILALWRDRSDQRIRRADDIERLLKLPVLLNVPGKGKNAMGLLPARSPGGQAFHELAHSLGAVLGHGNHVVLITSVTPGLGAGTVCANLAAALARTDDEAVLVCANLPSSYTSQLLRLADGPGLSEILAHGQKVSSVMQSPPELPQLGVITPGHDAELAWERLQTQSMDRLIAALRRHATYVIIEAPPTSTTADAQALAEVADAAIIVVEVPRAQREHVNESIRTLDRMGTAVLGAVVLPVQPDTVPPRRTPQPRRRDRDRPVRAALPPPLNSYGPTADARALPSGNDSRPSLYPGTPTPGGRTEPQDELVFRPEPSSRADSGSNGYSNADERTDAFAVIDEILDYRPPDRRSADRQSADQPPTDHRPADHRPASPGVVDLGGTERGTEHGSAGREASSGYGSSEYSSAGYDSADYGAADYGAAELGSTGYRPSHSADAERGNALDPIGSGATDYPARTHNPDVERTQALDPVEPTDQPSPSPSGYGAPTFTGGFADFTADDPSSGDYEAEDYLSTNHAGINFSADDPSSDYGAEPAADQPVGRHGRTGER